MFVDVFFGFLVSVSFGALITRLTDTVLGKPSLLVVTVSEVVKSSWYGSTVFNRSLKRGTCARQGLECVVQAGDIQMLTGPVGTVGRPEPTPKCSTYNMFEGFPMFYRYVFVVWRGFA